MHRPPYRLLLIGSLLSATLAGAASATVFGGGTTGNPGPADARYFGNFMPYDGQGFQDASGQGSVYTQFSHGDSMLIMTAAYSPAAYTFVSGRSAADGAYMEGTYTLTYDVVFSTASASAASALNGYLQTLTPVTTSRGTGYLGAFTIDGKSSVLAVGTSPMSYGTAEVSLTDGITDQQLYGAACSTMTNALCGHADYRVLGSLTGAGASNYLSGPVNAPVYNFHGQLSLHAHLLIDGGSTQGTAQIDPRVALPSSFLNGLAGSGVSPTDFSLTLSSGIGNGIGALPAVPEPAGWALLSIGVAALRFGQRRRSGRTAGRCLRAIMACDPVPTTAGAASRQTAGRSPAARNPAASAGIGTCPGPRGRRPPAGDPVR